MEWLYAVSAIASSIAAVLAWAAKLWWSREFAAAKDEIIKAKEAQIELLKSEITSLQELTPMRIREYFLSVKQQLEEYIAQLQSQLGDARSEISVKQAEIEKFKLEGAKKTGEIVELEMEIRKLKEQEEKSSNAVNKFVKASRDMVNMTASLDQQIADFSSLQFTPEFSAWAGNQFFKFSLDDKQRENIQAYLEKLYKAKKGDKNEHADKSDDTDEPSE